MSGVSEYPLIERAFAAGRVDESIYGDWADVQVKLGLKPFRERPRRPLFLGRDEELDIPQFAPSPSERKARREARAKRKQAKRSRKITRKKKKKKK